MTFKFLNLHFKYLNGLAEECSRLIASFTKKLKSGGMTGSQYKREAPRDIVGEMIAQAGYIRLPNGQVVEENTL